MAIMDMHLMQIDREATVPFRSNSNTVACVVEGRGESRIGGDTIAWEPRDIFTLPQGNWISHRGEGTARLFMASDRDALARLGILRDEYGNSAN
jgi:gentisate 1,2-dioxygenase